MATSGGAHRATVALVALAVLALVALAALARAPREAEEAGGRLIPQRIMQTWKTRDLSMRMREIAQSWELKNRGYVYRLYDDDECRRFIEVQFGSRALRAYDGIEAGAFRADLWRYCALYAHGGVYADLDTLCVGAIDAVVDPSAALVVPVDLDTRNLFNAFIGVVPRHPVMLACVERIVAKVEAGEEQAGLGFSGPGLLGECVADYIGVPRGMRFVPGTYRGIQLLHFSPRTEIVSNVDGERLLLNKNGDSGIMHVYMAESDKAGVVRYR
jgi:hypothetical protein